MINAREIVVGILWLASVVETFGYTWEAYKQTYTKFPGFSAGYSQNQATQAAQQASAQHSFGPLTGAAGVLHTLANAPLEALSHLPLVGGLFKSLETPTGALPAKERNRLAQLPNPPTNLVNTLKAANSGKGDLAGAANAFSAWAHRNNWRNSDINAYLRYVIGVKLF